MLVPAKKTLKKLLGFRNTPQKAFLAHYYQRHNQRRLEHLVSLGLDLAGCSVFEVGAGIGDHTHFFLDRGCTVTTSDGREENVKVLRRRYPEISVLHLDLDFPPQAVDDLFDLVYCYGLLYHLMNPSDGISFLSRCSRKLLLLETCVSYGDHEEVNLCDEDKVSPTQAMSGTGCRPTRPWIYNQLKKDFDFVYLPLTQPNHEEFPLDWSGSGSGEILSRAVFIASREQISNSLLTEEIPSKQRRSP